MSIAREDHNCQFDDPPIDKLSTSFRDILRCGSCFTPSLKSWEIYSNTGLLLVIESNTQLVQSHKFNLGSCIRCDSITQYLFNDCRVPLSCSVISIDALWLAVVLFRGYSLKISYEPLKECGAKRV
jgi:hypothetical protein